MIGRPSKYNIKLITLICQRIADGESLRKICLDEDMPSRQQVRIWLGKYPDFASQYACAHRDKADVHAEEIVDIADEPLKTTDANGKRIPKADMLAHMRLQLEQKKLRMDARKWSSSKGHPKKYGEIKSVEAEETDVHIHGGLPD